MLETSKVTRQQSPVLFPQLFDQRFLGSVLLRFLKLNVDASSFSDPQSNVFGFVVRDELDLFMLLKMEKSYVVRIIVSYPN
ncbi:hypothetical protein M5689_006937 [Euphorbia peplus]|nr:hypothetical protein M5689_006937 [Euphorbia peplus]